MKRLLAASLALAMSPAAFAASMGSVDVFYVPKADSDVGGVSDDGDGFGIKGQFNVMPQVAVTGEYRTTSYDDSDTDFDQLRIGGMYLIQGQSGAGLEYVSATMDGAAGDNDIDGFNIFGRLAGEVAPQIGLHGQLGYLMLSSDTPDEDVSGLEFSIGGTYAINKQFGVLLEWRRTDVEGDDSNIETTLTDIAIGARINL